MPMNIPPAGNELARENAHLGNLKVLPQPVPNLTVKVTGGGFWAWNMNWVEYPGGNSPALAVPAANPRIDVIAVKANGQLSVIQGSEAANPDAPQVPVTQIPLAAVRCVPAMTQITGDMIFDVRNIFAVPIYKHSTLTDRLNSVDATTNAHDIDAITGLQAALDLKSNTADLSALLDAKADTTGSDEYEFKLGTAGPTGTDGKFTVQGDAGDVSVIWDENADRWAVSEDLSFAGDTAGGAPVTVKGPILRQYGGAGAGDLYRVIINDSGALDIVAV